MNRHSSTVRVYLRRSKNDEGKQQFSLDVQRQGCRDFLSRLDIAAAGVSEYVDDGKSGDDFHSRNGIRRLLEDAKAGDVIVCRDQSRLGRDAIEVTLVVRDLVRDRGCRLFFYTTGQEVQFANAIDQATTFIQGTGHQMELEAIRSRTREALRARVREGRIAGGRCFGYRLERKADAVGRPYTTAVVDEAQAPIVRRIYEEYLAGRGLKAIAVQLNHEAALSPTVGRRGRGSWAPSGIREMLRNPRYRGVYVHGRVKKVRRSGRVERVAADPSDVIMVDVPEWRIIDDQIWFAVQELFTGRQPVRRRGRPAKYPLSGIGRCTECKGSIGTARTRVAGGEHALAYTCLTHHTRGSAVCRVTMIYPAQNLEAEALDSLREQLSPGVVQAALAGIRREAESRLQVDRDSSGLEEELQKVRAEQRKLARAVALADDVPELVTELNGRSARIRFLEAELAAAKRGPEEVARQIAEVEATAKGKLARLRDALLSDREGLRELFEDLFPDGMTFKPFENAERRGWHISGSAKLGVSNKVCDPTGT